MRVEGDGVHEIAVGPVHAGIIEPGHFRFSVVGEKVLRLEQHLGYVHKGIERRFTELAPLEAHRLAGRVSGDSTVAYAWAYCMALESAWRLRGAASAPQWLRALMLERERVANHLGDLGALGNDAALAFGLAQFSRLREDWQRLSQRGLRPPLHDGLRGAGRRGRRPVAAAARRACGASATPSNARCARCATIYDEHAGLQDRFLTTGRVTPELAAQLGLTGLAGRASGQAADLRCDHAWPPYDALQVTHGHAARAATSRRAWRVRFDETVRVAAPDPRALRRPARRRRSRASCQRRRPRGASAPAGSKAGAARCSWRWRLGADGRIARCHCHDPSWQNWPVLEHAVIGNIVPDFPLINKSFNLSYSGHDL